MATTPNFLNEICANCGFTYGSHHGGTEPYPFNYCPGHEGRMDWDKGPGTCFKGTGRYTKIVWMRMRGREQFLEEIE